MENQSLTNEQKNRIKEILSENDLNVLGIESIGGKVYIGAKPSAYEEIIFRTKKQIKKELGIDTDINI